MKKKICAALLAVGLILGSAGAVLAKSQTVSINQFVEHPSLDAIRQGLQDYLKEQGMDVNYIVHLAQANMATSGQIGRQQVGEKADLIVAIATPSAQSSVQAMEGAPGDMKRPVLFAGITDPVVAGLVKDVAHPPELVTGISDRLPLDLQLAMIREFMGPFKKLGYIYNPGETNSKAVLEELKALADKEDFEVVEATASKTADVYQAANSLAGRVDAVFVATDNTIVAGIEALVKVAQDADFPLFTADVDSVKRGSAASLGMDYYEHGRQAGAMAEKILKGMKPGDLPVEFQEKLELRINLPSAQAMGVTPPREMLDRATKVYK